MLKIIRYLRAVENDKLWEHVKVDAQSLLFGDPEVFDKLCSIDTDIHQSFTSPATFRGLRIWLPR